MGIQAGPEENRPSPLGSDANFKVWSKFCLGPIRDYPAADHPVNSVSWCGIWVQMKRIQNKMRQLERLTLHRAWDEMRLSWPWRPGRCLQGNEREGVANSSPLLKHIVWHSWRVILIKLNHIRCSQKNFWINFQRLIPRSWARLPPFVVLGFVKLRLAPLLGKSKGRGTAQQPTCHTAYLDCVTQLSYSYVLANTKIHVLHMK